MANFLRRFVEKSRSKSRSKSPTKRPPKPPNHADMGFGGEFEAHNHWQHPMSYDQRPQIGSQPLQRMPPMIRTQYVDERAEVC